MKTEEKKNNQFKELFWKTDKDKIQQILNKIPSKYLLGRFRDTSKQMSLTNWVFPKETHSWDFNTTINYDGYTFSVSRKTLKQEIRKRDDIKLIRLDIHSWRTKYIIEKPKKKKYK